MSKNTPTHKNFIEIRAIVNGAIIDKVRIPQGHLKKVRFNTKLTGYDRLFLVSEQYSQYLEKYL